MSRLSILSLSAAAVLVLAATALAEPYWIAWEGDDFPENQGWERNYGNWDGQWQGQANRTLDNGILTIDSLHDTGVFDFVVREEPGNMTLGEGEVFVAEWRMVVRQLTGFPTYDPGVVFKSDDAWSVSFGFFLDRVRSEFETDVYMNVAPDVFHTYRFVSSDMRSYELFIDGLLARRGAFWNGVGTSRVAWGDAVQGAASLSEWDYFRYGIVPEPSAAITAAIMALFAGRTRA